MFNHFATPNLRYSFAFLIASIALSSLSLPICAQDQDKDSAGVIASDKATAKDVGLPIYPGSKPRKDKDDNSTGANLGLWGGGSGFKLVVLKMESSDSPEKIAVFYKKALSKYGAVLDCSNPPPNSAGASKDDSKTLTCGDDKPDKGGVLFKSGTKERQHIVAIQPNGQGTVYQLLNVGAWGSK